MNKTEKIVLTVMLSIAEVMIGILAYSEIVSGGDSVGTAVMMGVYSIFLYFVLVVLWTKVPTINPVNKKDLEVLAKWLADNGYSQCEIPSKLILNYTEERVADDKFQFNASEIVTSGVRLELEILGEKHVVSGIDLNKAIPVPENTKFMMAERDTFLLVSPVQKPRKWTLYQKN